MVNNLAARWFWRGCIYSVDSKAPGSQTMYCQPQCCYPTCSQTTYCQQQIAYLFSSPTPRFWQAIVPNTPCRHIRMIQLSNKSDAVAEYHSGLVALAAIPPLSAPTHKPTCRAPEHLAASSSRQHRRLFSTADTCYTKHESTERIIWLANAWRYLKKHR